jgi:hypothetical protein
MSRTWIYGLGERQPGVEYLRKPNVFGGPPLRDRAGLGQIPVRDAKLASMRSLQPDLYRPFATVDAIVGKLGRDPEFDRTRWQKLVYLRSERAAYGQEDLRRIVQEILARGIRGSVRRGRGSRRRSGRRAAG